MNTRLFDVYRSVHEQGFLPIFVQDDFDSKKLVEACVQVGCTCIEYTLRRQDADTMIPWIKEHYPDLYLIVGSTIDDEKIVTQMRKKHSQLLSVNELDSMGVDGFVSMIGWSSDSIRKYSQNRLIIPAASTAAEALRQVGAGAHFCKIMGPDFSLLRTCRGAAAFDYCPVMMTGGMHLENINEAISAGSALIAAGFDLILKEQPATIRVDDIATLLETYIDTTKKFRNARWPELVSAQGKDRQSWLNALPHYHPF
jgi:2-keto-3-deoxy-6-phosphogluconate aldolase